MLLDLRGEVGVFGHEAIAGVDRVRSGQRGGGQDRGDVQVAVLGLRRADADGLIGKAHGHGAGVRRRMDGDGADAHLSAGANDPQGDFSTVGDQDFLEHDGLCLRLIR